MVRKGGFSLDDITGYFSGTPASATPAALPSTPVKDKNITTDISPKPASPEQSTAATSPSGKVGGRSRKRAGKSKKVRKSKKTRKQKRRS